MKSNSNTKIISFILYTLGVLGVSHPQHAIAQTKVTCKVTYVATAYKLNIDETGISKKRLDEFIEEVSGYAALPRKAREDAVRDARRILNAHVDGLKNAMDNIDIKLDKQTFTVETDGYLTYSLNHNPSKLLFITWTAKITPGTSNGAESCEYDISSSREFQTKVPRTSQGTAKKK